MSQELKDDKHEERKQATKASKRTMTFEDEPAAKRRKTKKVAFPHGTKHKFKSRDDFDQCFLAKEK